VISVPVRFRSFIAAKSDEERTKIIQETTRAVRACNEFLKENGYPPIMYYAIDEVVGQQLAAERDLMKAIHDAGGMVTVAICSNYFDAVGPYLHVPIINGSVPPEEYRRSQAIGHRVWIYAQPQGGIEDPEIYRRNYGLQMWKRGVDGACTYAYQSEFPEHADMWDDFVPPYRDHVMAYPTIDGVIDTVQWEGYREGVDDLRYLTTLLQAVESAKGRGRGDLAAQAKAWLSSVDIETDLVAIRRTMADWIVRLHQAR